MVNGVDYSVLQVVRGPALGARGQEFVRLNDFYYTRLLIPHSKQNEGGVLHILSSQDLETSR